VPQTDPVAVTVTVLVPAVEEGARSSPVDVQLLGRSSPVESKGPVEFADFGVSRFRFPSYDISMVSEDQIQSWADEAEAGYDVQELKRRGRGRPGRGTEPMQVVAVRLTAEEVAALDEVAEREHLSRSEAIRRALADFAA
jgi:hypothetical protein